MRLTPGLARDSDLSLLDDLAEIRDNINAKHLPVDEIRKSIIEKHAMINDLIANFNDDIEKEVRAFEPLCKKHSDEWVQSFTEHTYETWQKYMDQMYEIDDEFDHLTNDRIAANSNWQRPSLFFMPDTLRYMDQFSSSYPMYVFDKWEETREKIKDNIPIQQARKMRFYVHGQRDFLPRNCMGIILTRNYYTHRNMQTLIDDLAFFVELLGPSGTVAFNFNNCEISKSAAYFENGVRSFMLGTEVRREIWKAGLNITRWQYVDSVATTWVEATKPGEFKSIRKDEALGKIEEIKKSKKKI